MSSNVQWSAWKTNCCQSWRANITCRVATGKGPAALVGGLTAKLVQSTGMAAERCGQYTTMLQQCRPILIIRSMNEHEPSKKCSEPRTMLWSNSTSQVPALMRHSCATWLPQLASWFSCGTSASTRLTTPVSPSEKAGNCRPGRTCVVGVVWPKAWKFKRVLKEGTFMVGKSQAKWLHLATHLYAWYMFITVHHLFIGFKCLYINMLWEAQQMGWAFCLAMDFAF